MRLVRWLQYQGEQIFWVEGDAGKIYVVRRDVDGRWSCTCQHFLYHKRECKHIKGVERELEDTAKQLESHK